MSEQTDKRPNPPNGTGEVIPPATPGGTPVAPGARAVSASPARSGTLSKDDWIVLNEELPKPTYWPVTMAVAMTLIAFGIVNALLIIIIGIILLIISLVGWIGDVRDEARLRKH